MKSWQKISLISGVFLAMMTWLVAPLFNAPEETFIERVVSVETMTVSQSSFEESYRSVAFISPLVVTQAAFQNVGTITQINVKEGDRVVVNQILARIDDEQSRLQLQNAREGLSSAQFNLESAQANAQTQKSLYDKAVADDEARISELREEQIQAKVKRDEALSVYEANRDEFGDESTITITSLNTYNQAEIEYQIATTQYESALDNGESNEVLVARGRYEASLANVNANQSQVNIAKNNVSQAETILSNTTLRASVNGTVVRVVGNVNELATPLAPVVVIASDELKAVFGVPFQWLPSLFINQDIEVFNSTNTIMAKITSIAPLPDQSSRTYEVGVKLDANVFPIGSSVSVSIALDEVAGVWLPITSIMNDGQPYVFVVEEGRAIKRRISLEGFNNTDVRVDGLLANEEVIVNGIKSLRSGTLVKVVTQP